MINPTLIRKKSPTAFCLFAAAAAAGRTGQRAQSPPAWNIHVVGVFVLLSQLKLTH